MNDGLPVCCELCNGLPVVHGKARGHYVSRTGGRRMLVLERSQGERIRINEATELVVMEVHPERVMIAVVSSSGDGARRAGQ